MDRMDVLGIIRELAASQGSYGRLYRALMEADEEDRNAWFDSILEQEPESMIDIVMLIEGCY